MNHHRLLKTWAVLTAALIVSGCAVKQGETIRIGSIEYGITSGAFRSQWYDFYERGESYIEGALAAKDAGDDEAVKKAVGLGMADLRQALKMRDTDQRRARTYGMWMIDYFPHREMGVGYYLLGQYDEAASELEKSLSEVESAKAQFFLDKTRKAKIEQTMRDSVAPVIETGAIPPLTRDAEITIKATASDDGFVSAIAINGDSEPVALAAKTVEIERIVELEEGENEIEITASDLSGNSASKKIKVVSDAAGPAVTVQETSMAAGTPARMKIKGWASDPAGIKSLGIGDLEVVPSSDGSFGATVKIGENGKVKFIAEDSLGNKTEGEFGIGDETPQQGSLLGATLAGLFNREKFLSPTPAKWVIGAATPSSNAGTSIKIKGLTDAQTVYFESFYLEGEAYDRAGIATLAVGRQSLMSRPGQKVYFNYLRRLHRGTNKITIVAKNNLGEAYQKTIVVNREIPAVQEVGSRMSVSMLPFYLKGRVNLAEVAYEDLLKFLKESGRFRMIDRTQINKIVQELKISKAGLTDNVGAVKAGKLASAETVLLGFVYETSGSMEVYGRLVDTQTSEILAEKDAYLRQPTITLKDLLSLMNGLAVRIRNQFPMVQGEVAEAQGNNIAARLNVQTPLKAGVKIIIFRDKPITHPQTGIPLGNDSILITEARVQKVTGTSATAVLSNPNDSKKIRKSDKIITK